MPSPPVLWVAGGHRVENSWPVVLKFGGRLSQLMNAVTTSLLQVSSLHFVLELWNRHFLTYSYWRADAAAGSAHVALLVSSVTNCIASEISVPSGIFRDSNFFSFLKFAGVFRIRKIREFYEFFFKFIKFAFSICAGVIMLWTCPSVSVRAFRRAC